MKENCNVTQKSFNCHTEKAAITKQFYGNNQWTILNKSLFLTFKKNQTFYIAKTHIYF